MEFLLEFYRTERVNREELDLYNTVIILNVVWFS